MSTELIRIKFPALRDDLSGYKFLLKIASYIHKHPEKNYTLDFKSCSIIEQNAIAVLGGLCNFLSRYDEQSKFKKFLRVNNILGSMGPNKVSIDYDSINDLVKETLVKSKFLSYFEKKHGNKYIERDYIGYREHYKVLDANEIASHLSDQWLTDEKLSMSPDLKNAIVSKIFEIFMNAYGHGIQDNQLELSVISCGQYKPKENRLSLTVLDFGIGVVNSVKQHCGDDLSNIEAMKWALKIGNSTRTDSAEDVPRGLGFGLLQQFVAVNQGSLKIYSNNCCAHLDSNGEYQVEELNDDFPGTIVTVSINCDKRYYEFSPITPESEVYF